MKLIMLDIVCMASFACTVAGGPQTLVKRGNYPNSAMKSMQCPITGEQEPTCVMADLDSWPKKDFSCEVGVIHSYVLPSSSCSYVFSWAFYFFLLATYPSQCYAKNRRCYRPRNFPPSAGSCPSIRASGRMPRQTSIQKHAWFVTINIVTRQIKISLTPKLNSIFFSIGWDFMFF